MYRFSPKGRTIAPPLSGGIVLHNREWTVIQLKGVFLPGEKIGFIFFRITFISFVVLAGLFFVLPEDTSAQTILSAKIVTPPVHPVPSTGDLWMNTWADDDNIYTGWGDGEGPGIMDPGTDCGIAVLKETVPYFFIEPDPSDYVRCKFVPDGQPTSSILHWPGKRILFAINCTLVKSD